VFGSGCLFVVRGERLRFPWAVEEIDLVAYHHGFSLEDIIIFVLAEPEPTMCSQDYLFKHVGFSPNSSCPKSLRFASQGRRVRTINRFAGLRSFLNSQLCIPGVCCREGEDELTPNISHPPPAGRHDVFRSESLPSPGNRESSAPLNVDPENLRSLMFSSNIKTRFMVYIAVLRLVGPQASSELERFLIAGTRRLGAYRLAPPNPETNHQEELHRRFSLPNQRFAAISQGTENHVTDTNQLEECQCPTILEPRS